MNKINILNLLLFFLTIPYIHTQSVFPTIGEQGHASGVQLCYTVGEPVIITVEGEKTCLTQGFQQPFCKVEPLEEHFPPGSVQVFPNPFLDWINIRLNGLAPENVHVELFDLNGKCLLTAQLNQADWQTDLSAFPNTAYTLLVRDSATQLTNTFKIIKSDLK